MRSTSAREQARAFLQVAHLYRLGFLPTEQPHPETTHLSEWARRDVPRAVAVLKQIDLRALRAVQRRATAIDRLGGAIRRTLDDGRRIFLCGCGATGRLSLSLEFLWRQRDGDRDQVRALMAGGDAALVHSLEGFEDHPEYGARHLEEMGFADGDLLISCTEGGETPYVIGATEKAAAISSSSPYFLYCNRSSILAGHIRRFQRIHDNRKIRRICLDVGPMALAGSTRMQASTVLQLAVGLALLHPERPAREWIVHFRRRVQDTDFSFLAGFIEDEAAIYAAGEYVMYRVRDFGITVLTDTTERAPTFSLVPFDRLEERRSRYSLCYVSLEDAENPAVAWERLLHRAPRALDWPEVDPRTTSGYLQGFDFSVHALERRRRQIAGSKHHEFRIRSSGDGLELRLGPRSRTVGASDLPELFQHLLLKQLLNIHSTVVMGRLGRYENNLMTWVSPTNGKLVDRAVRYVEHLLVSAGRTEHGYDAIVQQLFAQMERLEPGHSVVLETYRSLLDRDRRTGPAELAPRALAQASPPA
jgi:N-acetylmuramic acid 6-phosphate etherase